MSIKETKDTQSSFLSPHNSSESSALSPQSSHKPLRWLVTGGCGFIGRNLVKNLVDEGGHHIRIVDNLISSTREDLAQVCTFTELDHSTLITQSSVLSPQSSSESSVLSPQSLKKNSSLLTPNSSPTFVELIVADILDAELALSVAQGMDIIVHLAANTGVAPSVEDPRADCMNNVIGTLNYLEAARQNNIRKFIFASSGAAIGECDPPIHEGLAPRPVSPYGASKLTGEGYCSAYCLTYGLKTVALRFGNVYGPLSSHKNSVVAKFINRALDGNPLEIYGDGSQTRDFIYVDDLVHSIRLSAFANESEGEVFQISSNTETTISQLAERLIIILKNYGIHKIQIRHIAPRRGDVKRNFSDTSKARKILGWRSEISLQEGLNKTLQWYIKQIAE